MRTSKVMWFLDIAQRCAEQGTCLRRNFGAVIVDSAGTIISTGYTGAPCGQRDCLEIGTCWRNDHNIPSGSNYEKCRSVHAEMNAMIQAGKDARGGTMYLAGFEVATGALVGIYPCFLCAKMMKNSGLIKVVVREPSSPNDISGPASVVAGVGGNEQRGFRSSVRNYGAGVVYNNYAEYTPQEVYTLREREALT